MNAPIVFIHYNDSKYLKYSLSLAVKNNPNTDVYLLGDQSNKHYESIGIKHFMFKNFLHGTLLKEFNDSYVFTAGKEFGNATYGEDWTEFNFKKWFVLLNFLKELDIDLFWQFDSDVFILSDLSSFEPIFKSYDYTSWNNHHQYQGLSSATLVIKYCEFILECFHDEKFLDIQRSDFLDNPTYGLTLMRIFKKFKEESGLNVINIFDSKLKQIDGVFCHNFMQESIVDSPKFEMTDFSKRKVKQLYYNSNGDFFVKDTSENNYIHVEVLDTSWLHFSIIRNIYRISTNELKIDGNEMHKLGFELSLYNRIKKKLSNLTPN